MKQRLIFLIVAVAALAATSCKHRDTSTDGLTDSEKLEVLDFRIEKHPQDAAALAERAQVLFNLGRTKEASVDATQAATLEPSNLNYRLLQADMYFSNGDVENSYKALAEAEKIDPQSTEVQLKMGEVTFYSRDYDRSIDCLTKVTAQDPTNQTALFMKGFIYKEKGDTAEAVTLLRKVCDLYPDYEPAFEELGVLYAIHLNPLAVEYLTTATRLQPNNTNALAMFYQDMQDYEHAEELYKKMLDINPQSADALHNMGYIASIYHADAESSIDYFTRAIEADNRYVEAFVNRGLAYETIGNRAAARADYEEALRLNAQFQPAIDGLKRIK